MHAAKDCLFCRILAGELPAAVVHRDEHCVAILDAFPLTRGHLLLVSTQHGQHIEDLPAPAVAHLFATAVRFSAALRRHGDSPATAIVLNNGKAANQHVPHAHVHVIPRRDGDTPLVVWRYLSRFLNPWSYIGRAQRLEKQAQVWRGLLQDAGRAA